MHNATMPSTYAECAVDLEPNHWQALPFPLTTRALHRCAHTKGTDNDTRCCGWQLFAPA